jgi:hypothetical protein
LSPYRERSKASSPAQKYWTLSLNLEFAIVFEELTNLFKEIILFKVLIKEGLMKKNGPIDFAQSLAICMKKSN